VILSPKFFDSHLSWNIVRLNLQGSILPHIHVLCDVRQQHMTLVVIHFSLSGLGKAVCWVVAPITWNFLAVKILFLGRSLWFSPCQVLLLGPFPPWTRLNLSVTTIQRLDLCSTLFLGGSWCWVVALIYWNFIGWWKPCAWASHGGFHPVTSWCMPLPSMDPPQFLCYDYTKAIFVFHIGVGW